MKKRNPKKNFFAIGDIHGCHAELLLLLEKLPLTPDSTLIFLGDYIDRGPHSQKVIQTILDLQRNHQVITLMGNHEEMLLSFLEDPTCLEAASFIYNGGTATLNSYSDEAGQFEIPPAHLEFFQQLRIFYETDDYFFVHAGVPDISLKDLDEKKHRPIMLWIRDKFYRSHFNWGKTIVHGHTPVREVEVTDKRINLDTGAVFENKLSAMEFPSRKVYSVSKKEKTQHLFLRNLLMPERRRAKRFYGKIPLTIEGSSGNFLFETLNYSDLGLLFWCPEAPHKILLKEGEEIKGILQAHVDSQNHFPFKGSIVRVEKKDKGIHYATDFLEGPFDYLGSDVFESFEDGGKKGKREK